LSWETGSIIFISFLALGAFSTALSFEFTDTKPRLQCSSLKVVKHVSVILLFHFSLREFFMTFKPVVLDTIRTLEARNGLYHADISDAIINSDRKIAQALKGSSFNKAHKNPDSINDRPAIKIKNLIMMGDSLSDRGTLNKTLLFGVLPMSYLSGLHGYSPEGRFTNGFVWSDHIAAKIASDFTIHHLEKRRMDDTDISDAIINGNPQILKAIRDSYSFDNDKVINYQGQPWMRSYCAGGLSAHDYSWNLSTSIIRFFTRLVVSTLGQMREQLFLYDRNKKISPEQKAATLVMEWSGANDLVTVNARPSLAEADRAIAARMDNVKKLIAAGYRNFVLFNIPNLALTPRFKALSKEEQDNAQKCSYYLSAQLVKACEQLTKDFPQCSVESFDINAMFERIYHNPELYSFDKSKLTTPYSTSKDLDNPADGISPATGYMFYDELHPSADMHALLASHFYNQLEQRYELFEPNNMPVEQNRGLSADILLASFRTHYEQQLKVDQRSFFSGARSNLNFKEADLSAVLRHGLKEQGYRTLGVLKKMGWINQEGQLILNEPVLKEAMKQVGSIGERNVLG
jgi:phospholipase/lecithinase/hemolysin